MAPGPFTTLGRVVKTHGLKGEVAVEPAAALSLSSLPGIQVWFTPPPVRLRTGVVEAARSGPKGPLLKVGGVDTVEEASMLLGREIVAKTAELPEDLLTQVEEKPDPVGLKVTDDERGLLGVVEDVIVTGANDVWVVDGPLGEVLLPVIDECVVSVDWDERTARVRLLPGLVPEAHE